jgi:hypothetical protein
LQAAVALQALTDHWQRVPWRLKRCLVMVARQCWTTEASIYDKTDSHSRSMMATSNTTTGGRTRSWWSRNNTGFHTSTTEKSSTNRSIQVHLNTTLQSSFPRHYRICCPQLVTKWLLQRIQLLGRSGMQESKPKNVSGRIIILVWHYHYFLTGPVEIPPTMSTAVNGAEKDVFNRSSLDGVLMEENLLIAFSISNADHDTDMEVTDAVMLTSCCAAMANKII